MRIPKRHRRAPVPKPDSRISVRFSRGLAVSELWLFGEDQLAEVVLEIDDADWDAVLELGAYYRSEKVPVPVTETKVSNGHSMCFACMHHIEGAIRPLARARRRPKSALPGHIAQQRSERLPPLFGRASQD